MGIPAQSQKVWESLVYWNHTNINLFNYDVLYDKDILPGGTATWVAGDSIVAFIYPGYSGNEGLKVSNVKFPTADFQDSAFSSPLISNHRISIEIDNEVILDKVAMDQLLSGEIIINKYLQTVKFMNRLFLALRCSLKSHDSITITTTNLTNGALLCEYKIYKADPYPRIIAAYDLSEKEQFTQLMQKRDSLQINSEDSLAVGNFITVSPFHNDLLLLLKRFEETDTLRVQYRLLSPRTEHDTSWKTIENEIPVIQFNNMTKGQKYTLQLRYNLTPHVIKEYRIKVDIYWWQITYVQILIAFIAGVVLTGTGWSIYKRRKEKQLLSKEEKRKQLELQMTSVRAQLNPHFIFNAMGTLQFLINHLEIEKANSYLGRVSILMRSALESSTKIMWSLDEELEYIRNYLEIESLRFEFRYTIEVEMNLSAHEVEMPAIFMQPIVENAIKHGLAVVNKGILEISVKKANNTMVICIKDNGPGFKTPENRGRFGLQLTFERIKLLNQILQDRRILFDIESLPGNTQCILQFENWL